MNPETIASLKAAAQSELAALHAGTGPRPLYPERQIALAQQKIAALEALAKGDVPAAKSLLEKLVYASRNLAHDHVADQIQPLCKNRQEAETLAAKFSHLESFDHWYYVITHFLGDDPAATLATVYQNLAANLAVFNLFQPTNPTQP